MCGRFVSASAPDEIGQYFDVDEAPEQVVEPSWNVAPTRDVYVVLEDGGTRRLDAYHWGLVPFWAKAPSAGAKMINARAESLAEKSAYKRAFAKRRCIVPADGFYEWDKASGQKRKQPYFIHREDGEPLAFAGLWERWRGPDREGPEQLRSCTIVTTQANELMATIHDRMPVLLPARAWSTWLDESNHDLDALGQLLVPAPPELLVMHPVGFDVGNVRNDRPDLVAEVDPEADRLDLG